MSEVSPEKLGSHTAKMGFKNEDDVIEKFNNWQNDVTAQEWLTIMDYRLDNIEYVQAVKIFREKTAVQVQVTVKMKKAIDVQNLQVKLVSNLRGFNQIDKRRIEKYIDMWDMPVEIADLLRYYTGELKPCINNAKDKRRLFANEFSEHEQQLLVHWLTVNKQFIIADVLKGRGPFAAEWMLVAQKASEKARWVLKPMNFCLNHYSQGEIRITKRGTFMIGRITMQRKGGDAGRDSAKMLQFKINPAELFG